MGLFQIIQTRSLIIGLFGGCMMGCFFGGSMALSSVWSDWRNRAAGKPIESNSVVQKRTITIAASKVETMRRVTEAIKALKATCIASKSSSDVMEATVPWSWKSFGEKLSVSIKHSSGAETVVEIISCPKSGVTLVDYGKNFDNVEFVCERITAQNSSM